MNIFNNSDYDLNIDSLGLITVERLIVLSATGSPIATALVNKNQIDIPAHGAWMTDWIDVRIPLTSAFDLLTGGLGFDYNNYQYKLAINVAGFGKYTIG